MKYSSYNEERDQELAQVFVDAFTASDGVQEGQLLGSLMEDLLQAKEHEDIRVFVAQEGDRIVGCVVFSPMEFEESKIVAYLLSPMVVSTDQQGKGVGQGLIHYALDKLQKDGVELVLSYGDPAFYGKLGFAPITEEVIRAPMKLSYPHGWIARPLKEEEIKPIPGRSHCIDAFKRPDLW